VLDAAQGLVRAERVAAALLEVSERLSTLTDPDEVPGTLVAAIRSATGASLAGVARWSTEAQRVEFAAFEGLTGEEQAALLALDPGPNLGIVQGALEGRSAVFVPPFDPVDIPVAFAEALRITAIAGSPIVVGDHVWGFLVVATREGDPSLVEHGAELLRGFATITATALGRTEAIAELERSHGALEAAVAERTLELTQVVEELSRANRAKAEFLANVSHELRTPLTSILGFTDLLLHGMEGPLTPAQREDLRTIDAAGGRLLGLIDDLIEVSDIEAGRVELRIEPVALTPFLEERAAEIRSLATRKDQTVELDSGSAPAIIYADEGRLRTVLRNLLSNAVRFTPAEGSIRIAAAGDGDGVRIDVTDTGVGIETADQERIFERFQRAAPRDVPGTGLGLALAREYSRLHGGDITVESTPGAGSRFSVVLPGVAAPTTWREPGN
jgi:signal transduction histidine kinase